ncbi:unnamed protein product [Paramecium octaurelia]|uniref:Uncharacterized protein n=1 Tax=Paramecium octaurelia TaxID=43137 RepID=A0A8S1YSG3_PAROT|nr:unnamed protein product [Paramecium octaurelia]
MLQIEISINKINNYENFRKITKLVDIPQFASADPRPVIFFKKFASAIDHNTLALQVGHNSVSFQMITLAVWVLYKQGSFQPNPFSRFVSI